MPDTIPNIDFEINPADVVTVPIDKTLSIEGEAADAKAVGDALANKADKSEIATAIKVDGQGADAQGEIVLLAGHIPMDGSASPRTVGQEITSLKGRTGEDIPLNTGVGAPTIAEAVAEIDSGVTVSGGAMTMSGSVTDDTTEVDALSVGGDTLPLRDSGAVRSVNGIQRDANGNVRITNVETANNLVADDAQSNLGTFAIRSSGGTTSVANGSAWLARLRGHMEHTGVVQEVLDCVVNAAARAEGENPITATVNPDAFKGVISESEVITLVYTTEWSANPELIGVTVTGTPVNGDEIVITYVKADRGTITPATPTSFRATGWNLYSHASGYARVVKYSTEYGFRVEGAYTSLAWSETLNGARQAITPAGGNFNIPGDGYVWVTGSNATSTCIYMTWSNWTDGHEGSFAAYSESVINLASLMSQHFPDGLLAVGAVADEIDFSLQTATSNIEVMAYSEEAITELEAEGRAYEADTDTIYAVRQTPQVTAIQIAGQYTVNDHGLEFFGGTDVSVEALILYGQNLRDKLRTDVLTISQQLLTNAQKAQVRANLGAVNKAGDTMTGVLAIKSADGVWSTIDLVSQSGFYTGQVAANHLSNFMTFREISPSGKSEFYKLPDADNTQNDAVYSILTSKTPVTVAQGGTGMTGVTNGRTTTAVGNYISGGDIFVNWCKWGPVVSVSGWFPIGTDVPASEAFMTLPFAPIVFGAATAVNWNGTASRALYWNANEKKLRARDVALPAYWWYTSFTYMTNE